MRPVYQIGLVLLGLVLVPALVLASYALYTASEDETLLANLRDQQLETLLFSVNQNAWDVADGWASQLAQLPSGGEGAAVDLEAAAALVGEKAALRAVLAADTALVNIQVVSSDSVSGGVARALDAALVSRLLDRRRVGYRQLVPVELSGRPPLLGLAFLGDGPTPEAAPRLFVFVLDTDQFIADVILPKLREVARGQYALGIFVGDSAEPIAATGAVQRADVRQTRDLWLLPGYVLGIDPGPDSVEVARAVRLRQTLLLLGALALVLLGGAVVVWRGVRREVELARLKQDFVSNVSHELRTPLALIRMYAETLEAGRVTDEAQRQRYYRILGEETDRLGRLVNNVLSFSRIEAGRAVYAAEPVDLQALTRELLDRYALRLEREGLRVEADLQPVPPVRGDREALAEVLVNLLDNAVKYGADGGELLIRTQAVPDGVALDVADRGPGIPVRLQARIFEPFYRIQAESADGLVHTAKGSGLGLALVRHIAEAHGGTIAALPRDGGGTVFRLTLPAPPVPANGASVSVSPSLADDG